MLFILGLGGKRFITDVTMPVYLSIVLDIISNPVRVSLLGRLGNFWTWDREVVKNGVFENENIMIHVGQNLFNFVFTTLAWWIVSQIYSSTAGLDGFPREARNAAAHPYMDAAYDVVGAIRHFENRYR